MNNIEIICAKALSPQLSSPIVAGGEFDVMRRRILAASSPALAEALAPRLKQYQPERDGETR